MLINLPPHRSLSFYIYDLRKHSLVQSVTALFNWYFRLSSERGERAKSWYHISVNSSFYPKLISINEWGGALIILSSASLLIFTLQSLWFGIKVEKAYISYWEGCLIDTSIFQASYANNFFIYFCLNHISLLLYTLLKGSCNFANSALRSPRTRLRKCSQIVVALMVLGTK